MFGTDGQLLHALRCAQHDSDLDEIVDHSRRPRAIGAAGTHVIDQHCRGERQGVRFADRVTLEELRS